MPKTELLNLTFRENASLARREDLELDRLQGASGYEAMGCWEEPPLRLTPRPFWC